MVGPTVGRGTPLRSTIIPERMARRVRDSFNNGIIRCSRCREQVGQRDRFCRMCGAKFGDGI